MNATRRRLTALSVLFGGLVLLPTGCGPDPARGSDGSGEVPTATRDRESAPSPPSPPDRRRPIEIDLPTTPPADDPVEPGTWVLSHYIVLASGQRIDERQACRLDLEGEQVTIQIERSPGEPIRGSLRDGRLEAKLREGSGTFELRGQVIGPGRLVGRLTSHPTPGGLEVEDGRWSLERMR